MFDFADLTLDISTTVIHSVKYVYELDVHLDSESMMKTHISNVVSSCYHQHCRIRQVRRLVGQDVAQQEVLSCMLSWLDYCNSTFISSAMVSHSSSAACDECSNMNLSVRDHVKRVLLKVLH